MTIKLPALKRPTLEQLKLKKDREYIAAIESDNSTEEAVEIEFVSVLKEGEIYINGSEYETRLKARKDVILGWQHRNWLLENQDKPEVEKVLDSLRKDGVWYIDFTGLVVVREDGDRCIPCARSVGRQWCGDWCGLQDGFNGNGRIAVSASSVTRNPENLERSLGSSDTLVLELLERIAVALERIADKYAPKIT